MSRLNPNKAKDKELKEISFATSEADGEDRFAAAMINSNVLQKHGYEAKASLSRANPDGYGGPGRKAETSQYFHIENSASPFFSDSCGISSKICIELCQKAFYSFPSFHNPILMQSYLSKSPLHFSGKNKKIVSFYEQWSKKAKIWEIANEFFLEWYRSGNVFIYRFEGDIKLSDVKKLANEAVAKNRQLPLRYIVLNPADISGLGSSSFSEQSYGKTLNSYEVERLRNPRTEEDKRIYDGLEQDAKIAIQAGQCPVIKLDMDKIRIAFNAKQSYEAMAIPPYFGVLKSINFKQILRSAEYLGPHLRIFLAQKSG